MTPWRLGAAGALLLASVAGQSPMGAIPKHIEDMELSTPRPVTKGKMTEYKQDFVDVDFNRDGVMDAQEVRAHFKGGIALDELYSFFVDCDKDNSGTISLQEYVDYAAML